MSFIKGVPRPFSNHPGNHANPKSDDCIQERSRRKKQQCNPSCRVSSVLLPLRLTEKTGADRLTTESLAFE